MSNDGLPARNAFDEPSAATPSSEVSLSDWDIFISYRLEPDQPLAIALKKQLELSLEPRPRVFVSGFRGLQPSDISWDTQLQRAVQSAKGIIGIITPESKDRDWILFEAGAAWGRGIMYAPLLVNTDSSDIPRTLSPYIATKADDSTQVETLLESLAKRLGARVKRPLRLQPLKSALHTYPGLDTERDEALETRNSDLEKESWRAFGLMLEGKHEEADQLFQELDALAGTPDEKVYVKSMWLQSSDIARKENNSRLKLVELDESLKNTAEYHYWLGRLETGPHRRLEHLRQCLAMNGRADTRRNAYLYVAQLQHALGRSSVAEQHLLKGVLGEDRILGAQCAFELEKQLPEGRSLAKLAALIAGVCAHPSDELLNQLYTLTSTNSWLAPCLYLAKRHDTMFENGISANNLGRALHQLNLPSLSYEAYSKATESGVSVAKANLARLVGHAAVPLVGLKLLESHSGSFDAAAPNYPHEVRANLEEQVHQERKRLEQLDEHGRRLFQMFTLLVEKGLSAETSGLVQGSKFRWRTLAPDGQWQDLLYECTVEPSGKVTFTAHGVPAVELTPLFPGRGIFEMVVQQQTKGFMALSPEGGFEGSQLDLKSTSGALEWIELTKA